MTGPCFVDTNVLVYADDARDAVKRDKARDLLRRLFRERTGKLSLQILEEFFAAATRKLGMSALDARGRIEAFSYLDVVRLDVGDVLAAVDLHRLHALSIWDALVVRAAMMSGCRTLYTEDLQHGRRFEGLVVVDPFRSDEKDAPA